MKKTTKTALALIVVLAAGYDVYRSQENSEFSELALANIEALANGEWNDGDRISCSSFITSPQPDKLQHGVNYPIVVDCEPCGNLVVAKYASGMTTCTYYKH